MAREKKGEKKGKSDEAQADGRHARAERTRDAIVAALLGLLKEGDLKPSADRVAERAGVSRRVIFHHFKDLEDLLTRASTQWFAHIQGLLPNASPMGSFADRSRMFATGVAYFYEHVSHVRRAALLVEHESQIVARHMELAQQIHRDMVRAAFSEEIAATPEHLRHRLTAGLAGATSFSIWNELRRHQGLSTEEAIDVLMRYIEGLVPSKESPKAQR